MAYGIGSVIGDIDQKVDTYRNNPEALAQMYQQNQQLIDLLALQKLKTEKEAAMRDMQMKMQTPAASIKDQREQEVMGMMRNEVAQQMGPGLQAAGQQAAQAAAPQGGGLQSLPAPNMQSMGMAEGGIVAFAGERGSYVSQEAYRRQKAKEQEEKKRRENAASAAELEAVYGNMASAQGTAALPYSSESILQDLMARASRPTSTGRDDVAPVDPGPGSVEPRVSREALRKFDEQRAAGDQDSSSIGDAIKDQWNKSQTRELLTDPKAQWERSKTNEVADYLARVPGAVSETVSQATSGLGSLLRRASSSIAESEGRTVPESPAQQTPPPAVAEERVTPATKGPEMTVPAAVQTVKDYVANASITPPTELEELRYRNALRVLGTAGISRDDLFRGGEGFFSQDSGVLGMGEEGLQAEAAKINRQLQTIQAYKEYGVPPPESFPSEEELMQRLKVVNAFLAPASQAATPTATPDAPQAAPRAAPQAATPEISDADTEATKANVMEMLGENIRPTTTQAAPQEQPQYRSRYEDQLAALETEGQDKMGALIDFLQGAGGKTSFAATMAGGGSRLRERDARLDQEKADVLKNLIADERAQQAFGLDARRAAAAERANDIQEKLGLEGLAARKEEASIAAKAAVQKARIEADQNATEAEQKLNADVFAAVMESPEYLKAIKEIEAQYGGGLLSRAEPEQAQAAINAKFRALFATYKGRMTEAARTGSFPAAYE